MLKLDYVENNWKHANRTEIHKQQGAHWIAARVCFLSLTLLSEPLWLTNLQIPNLRYLMFARSCLYDALKPGRSLPTFRGGKELSPFLPLTRVPGVTSRKTVLNTPVVFYVEFVVLRVQPLNIILTGAGCHLTARLLLCGVMEV